MRIPRRIIPKVTFLQHWTKDEFENYFSFCKDKTFAQMIFLKIVPIEIRAWIIREWFCMENNEDEFYQIAANLGISILGFEIDVVIDILFRELKGKIPEGI